MVVKSDGSKWACSSCLKGHRVSGCNHTDRELTLVPKKGRPVTQCHHCRLERKKRSAHVKCDCGETEKVHHPKEKCIHLREAEERAKAGFHEEAAFENDPAHLSSVAEEQGCCCHHGGKCTCSLLRKESSDKGKDVAPHGPAVHKPRLESVKSDGSITVFANGHHKPVHRKNHTAHESGMPYKMPLCRAQTDQNLATAARRSVDSLSIDTNMGGGLLQFNMPFNVDRSLSKSEQHSPKTSTDAFSASTLEDTKMAMIDFAALSQVRTNHSVEAADPAPFPTFDPMSGIDCAYDPWSTYPSGESFDFQNNPFGAWATTFDGSALAQPALTAASSTTHSDIDEIPPMDEMYHFNMPSIAEDDGAMTEANSNRRSLPPNFFGNADFSTMDINDWQMPDEAAEQKFENNKARPLTSSPGINDNWPTPTMSHTVHRGTPGGFSSGRPQSHSIGPGSAPNDDLIRQLFPDIDIASTFGNGASPGDMASMTMKRFGGLPFVDPTSAPIDFTDADADGFTAQPWADGSVSVPNDAISAAFNLDQEFTASDLPESWQHNL